MRAVAIVSLLLGVTFVCRAVEPVVTGSYGARLLHDTNLFLADPAPLAAGQTRPGEPAREFATAIDVSAAMTVAVHAGERAGWDLSYAPELVRYVHHASENHTDHSLLASASVADAGWTADAKLRYLYTDGAEDSPVFNGLGGSPAIGGEPVRARRAQAILRGAGRLVHESARGFVRGVFSTYDQDFRTHERSGPGYCNYADRNETTLGVEAGRRVLGPVAVVVGVRAGVERQANELGVPLNYSNRLTRWLAGIEGSPRSTLKLSALAGPDVRHFGRSVREGFQREQRTWYAEAAATWTPVRSTSVMLAAKRYLWLIASGRGAYTDGLVDLSCRQKLGARWSASAGANWHDGGFNRYALRHDRIYTGNVGLSRALPGRCHLDLDLMHDWAVTFVPNTPSRAYTRWIGGVSVGGTW